MSEQKETSQVKLVLECVALVVTIVGTAFGAWTALASNAQQDQSQAAGRASPTDEQHAYGATTESSHGRPSSAATIKPFEERGSGSEVQQVASNGQSGSTMVTPASFATPTNEKQLARLEAVLAQYPAALFRTRATVSDVDADDLIVDITVEIDAEMASRFHGALVQALLSSTRIDSPARIEQAVRTHVLSLVEVGDRAAQRLLSSAAERDEPGMILASVSGLPAGRLDSGVDAVVSFWQLAEDEANVIRQTFERASAARFQLEIVGESDNVLATKTIPSSFPEPATRWSADRYVTPLMPAGSAWSLKKLLLAPDPALDQLHRRSENTARVMVFCPFVSSVAERSSEKSSRRSPRAFTQSVTYQVRVPIPQAAMHAGVSCRVAPVVSPPTSVGG